MTTFSDQLKQFGGAPVNSVQNFEGWWGADTFFVDYDNGSAGVKGTSMDKPQKHLRIAINNASAGDTIYVRPRSFDSTATYPEDPRMISPDTAANFVIAKTKTDLSVIGATKGAGHAQAHQCWIGAASGVTDHILTVYAPGVVLENFRAQPSTGKAIIYGINNATYDCGNLTIQNWDFHDGNTSGGIQLDAVWQVSIVGNRFVNCDKGVYLTGYYSIPQIVQIWNNTFTVAATEVNADVDSLAGVYRFLAYNNYHAADQPSQGAPNKYYNFTVASTGAIFNCFFGTNVVTEGTAFTLNNVRQAGNYCMNGLMT